jgi:hypothetical protein
MFSLFLPGPCSNLRVLVHSDISPYPSVVSSVKRQEVIEIQNWKEFRIISSRISLIFLPAKAEKSERCGISRILS